MLKLLATFAQTYTYNTDVSNTAEGGIGVVAGLIGIGVTIFLLAAMWKVYTKAKQPGWASLVPIYNALIELKIVGRPWWWLLLMLIPVVNIVIAVIVLNDLSKSFGKDVAFTVLLFFLPFIGLPILAWGNAEYKGPSAAN
ncbi:MAG TPA: DUF5684 domain-containing protein [Candidatus Saccharimonadales bacterium]|nr:DUF5684 domain-containing protein [Candidatus Saccharimonadales bacterium]